MKKTPTVLFFLLIFRPSFSQDNNYRVENAQQRQATYVIDQIEKNNIDSVYKYFDPTYLRKEKEKIKKTLTEFHSGFLAMNPEVKRGITLVWPTGYNLFRIRYFDSTGTALQLDLSYKQNDVNSKIVLVETISKETFKKQRAASLKGPQVIIAGGADHIKCPRTTIIYLRNCSNEMRTITFNNQLTAFVKWVHGDGGLETNKVVQFSPQYQLDSGFFRQSILKIRKTLPKDFWSFSSWGELYNNVPNQDSIWFMHLYAQVDKNENIKIFSAYKVTFEGNDARNDKQRINPRITNVEFITDKSELLQLEKKLKEAKKVE